MKEVISSFSVDYCDLRYEVDKVTQINFRGKELNFICTSLEEGYHLRVLDNGRLATASITNKNEIAKVFKQLKLATKLEGKKVKFKFVAPVIDKFKIKVKEDTRKVSLDEKIEILRKYNEIILSSKKVATTNLVYEEWVKEKHFINSIGSDIEQEEIICGIKGSIIAKEGNRIEDIRVSVGGSADFSKIRNREDVFIEKTKIVCDLLKAEKIKPGIYTVLFDNSMIGLFIHEAFGHFSEADLLKDNPTLIDKLKIGDEIASKCLTVIDDPTIEDYPGFRVYDDEGVKSQKVILIKDGILCNRMHSIETAEFMDANPTGHSIAVKWQYTPIVRMSNIFVSPGTKKVEELLSLIDYGIYVCGAKGGETAGDEFSFGAQYGYEIKDGKIGKLLHQVNLSGNLFTTLKNVVECGEDLKFDELGGCGKNGQINPKSGKGGPHTIIKNVVVG